MRRRERWMVLRYSLLTEILMRTSSQMGYTALLVIAYNQSHNTLEIGIVSVGIVLPSLLFVKFSAYINTLNRAWSSFAWSSTARFLALGLAIIASRNWFTLMVIAALIGFTQQVIQTAKMTLDTWIVPGNQRVTFSSSKATVASLATMIGPPLAGAIAGLFGPKAALALVALLGIFSIFSMLPVRFHSKLSTEALLAKNDEESGAGRLTLTQALSKFPDVVLSFATYVLVVIILEMEVPLLFPFVHEIYARGAEFAGYLLGVCGIGTFAGALFMKRWGRPFTPTAITLVLILDGAALMIATRGVPLPILFALFSVLGVISAVTLVSTETQIQNVVPAEVAAPLFSLMFFAGGAGGAAMTLISTAIAQKLGASRVLFACGGLEIAIGLAVFSAMGALTSYLQKRASNGQ